LVKIAVIGTGYWGKNHVRVFKELLTDGVIDGLKICDVDIERAKKYGRIFDIEYTDDVEQLANDPEIGGVSIVTPSKTHFDLAKRFMEAGKDVFVEKPMTMDLKSADELVKIAESTGRILMVGHVFRYHPALNELKKRIDRGDLGDIYYMHSSRLSFRGPRKDMGVLFALAIHEVDIFCYLLGEKYPIGLTAHLGNHLQPDIEETAWVMMNFKEGVVSHAFESWVDPTGMKLRDLTVVGSLMSAKVDYLRPQELRIFDASISESKDKMGFVVQNDGSYVVPIQYREPLKEELVHFIKCINEGEKPLSDMYVGKRAVEMIEIAFESAKTGKTITLDPNKG
jgi:predicted dehydrogenase